MMEFLPLQFLTLWVNPGVHEAPVLVEGSQVMGVVVLQETQNVNVHWHVPRRSGLSLSVVQVF